MKKVLLIANEYTTIVDFRLELLEGLVNKGYDVFVALPDDSHNELIRKRNCRVISLEMSRKGMNPFNELKTILSINKVVNDVKPDIILTFTIKPNSYGGFIAGIKGIPYIANITGLGTAIESNGLVSKISLMLYRLGLKKASCVYFQNESNKQYMLNKRVVEDNYRLIPGSGVNLNKYKLLAYPTDNKVLRFGYIARVMYEKGIEEYITAAEAIRSIYPNCEFHIFGYCEQGYEGRMADLSKKGTIIYHGQVDDMVSVYNDMHCIVHPSFYPEGLSNVLLEASASGRPIITTDKPGCKELVVDGYNGFMIKQKDAQDLIDKLNKFIGLSFEEKKEMGINGRKYIEDKYDRNIVVNTYIGDIERFS